ncbi:tumor necrosis factor ligand superfamily member 14 [Kryptolebias marmoratus]|uniref:tumor necrosis factor ligand superfamily member 14 n=1 Tax=Kryptolebias marmoratus TaxID=37003 RepID=UPI0007F926DD|nr:tumor necrosis factor ligand superfamily member 14 [Kryptolebias marmoratus]
MSEMSERGTGPPPQVFVVDSQASYIPMPSGKKSKWTQEGMKILLLLLGLCMLGLVIEGYLIYKVYQKAEALSLMSLCHNSSTSSGQQVGTISRQIGHKESNEISQLWPNDHRKPFAHLMGSRNSANWVNNVVQWEKVSESETYKMKYEDGQLMIEEEGIYYLYSKVEFNAAKNCEVISHNMMKRTKAYDNPLDLMKSKSNRCFRSKHSSENNSNGEDLKSSFLAGIYRLERGDKIYVTLSNQQNTTLPSNENFMGAFMISQ